jgi:hypothetical protein
VVKPGTAPEVVRRRLFAYLARRGVEAEVCRAAIAQLPGAAGGSAGGDGA